MVVLVACKNAEDQIKKKSLEWLHYSLNFQLCKGSLIPSSVVSDGILPKFKLVQAVMDILVTCKNEKKSI